MENGTQNWVKKASWHKCSYVHCCFNWSGKETGNYPTDQFKWRPRHPSNQNIGNGTRLDRKRSWQHSEGSILRLWMWLKTTWWSPSSNIPPSNNSDQILPSRSVQAQVHCCQKMATSDSNQVTRHIPLLLLDGPWGVVQSIHGPNRPQTRSFSPNHWHKCETEGLTLAPFATNYSRTKYQEMFSLALKGEQHLWWMDERWWCCKKYWTNTQQQNCLRSTFVSSCCWGVELDALTLLQNDFRSVWGYASPFLDQKDG